jgi:hypothetical protein
LVIDKMNSVLYFTTQSHRRAVRPSRFTFYAIRLAVLYTLIIATLFSASPIAAQDDISFTAKVDRTSLSTDQTLTLELTLSGAFVNAGKPDFPALQGFSVVGSSQSSQFSMVNGKTSSQVSFIYQLQPTQTGDLTIPAISIQAGGHTYQTDPITVKVTQGAAPPAAQSPGEAPADTAAPQTLDGQDLYVEAEVDNATPFVGQQITYTFRLYQGVQFFNQPQLDWPEFTGFLGYDLSPNTQYYQDVASRQYLVTEVRRALFPTAPGQITVDAATLSVPGGFFDRGTQLQTNAVAVDVQALPAGAPADFTNAVGEFALEATVEPAETYVNEPVTLRVRVHGVGNINVLPDPTDISADAFPGWRVYDAQVTTDVSQDGNVIQGEKTFERLLVPKTEGTLTIPAFALTYFDPESGTYQHAETAPLQVNVAAGETEAPGAIIIGGDKQDVVVLGSDIRHIKPAPPALVAGHPSLLNNPLYWMGWGLPLLTVVGTWLWQRRQQTLANDVAYARLLRARKSARKRLAEARKLATSDDAAANDAAYAAVARALTHYLGDKFNLPAAGLTRDAIRQTLAAKAVPEEMTARLLDCLDWADSGRFAPVAAGKSVHELVKEAEATIAALEGMG